MRRSRPTISYHGRCATSAGHWPYDPADMKGVILAGGTGTRLHPLTRITNKHLLPIYDRPMVTYAIEALVRAGVDRADARHRRHARRRVLPPARQRPRVRHRPALRTPTRSGAGGIAEALGLAERFVDRDRVVVMLADNVFERSIRPSSRTSSAGARRADRALARVDEPEHLRHLGVPELDGDGRSSRILEKPEQPPSEYAVTGIYFYDATVSDFLPTLEPSGRGELEITDVNNWFVEQGTMEYDVRRGLLGRRRRVDRRVLRGQRLRARRTAPTSDRGVCAGSRCGASRTSAAGSSSSTRASWLPKPMRQTNVSFSRAGVIRGLHYHERGQDDLFVCLAGHGARRRARPRAAARRSPRTSATRTRLRSTSRAAARTASRR